MKRVFLFLFLFAALNTPFVVAQTAALPALETISPENVDQLKELVRWEGINNGFVAATFSPDGKTLALALNDGNVRLLEIPSLEQINILSGADTQGSKLVFSPDGTHLLLTHWDGTYRLWDVQRGELVSTLSFQFDEYS